MDSRQTIGGRLHRFFFAGFIFAVMVSTSSCTTLSTPVLRHETGEVLGAGKFKVVGRLETTRIFPLTSTVSPAVGVPQESSAFQGGLLGVQATGGIHQFFDVTLGTFYTGSGGGWRVGTKFQWMKKGNWASAMMAGYGRFSSKGSESYLAGGADSGTLDDVTQVLSASHIDFAVPLSLAIGKVVTMYTALSYFHNEVTGTANLSYVEVATNDFGLHLGTMIRINKFEGSAEFALVEMYDPFADGIRIVPYFGISAGIRF